jgi:SAM-dependent methyltransferase
MKLPLPPRDELLEYLASFDYFSRQGLDQIGRDYAAYHLPRFLRSLDLMPQLPEGSQVLELGAAPYLMTVMVEKYLGHKVTAANFQGDYDEAILQPEAEITISSKRYGESYTYPYKIFNVERDPYPYPDHTFDMVLCCELLEHLVIDASHMLRESHRVLKPGGYLFMTTPNAIGLIHIFTLICGGNIYAQYSSDGVYGRHNREYTPGELGELLKLHNFEPTVVVDNIYPHDGFEEWMGAVGDLPDRKDNLFAVARATGEHVINYPAWLYAGFKKRKGDVSTAPSAAVPSALAPTPSQPLVTRLAEGVSSRILKYIADVGKAKYNASCQAARSGLGIFRRRRETRQNPR